jgi:uncharacterized protein with HEPN domain
MKKDPNIYIGHMLECIEAIEKYVDGLDERTFMASEEKQSAVLWKLATLGEAAAKMSVEFREQHPAIPWKDIVATRNLLIHEYFGIDPGTVWRIVERDLPRLAKGLAGLLP